MRNKNQHEWAFMGNEVGNKHRGDLAYCELCDKWTWHDIDPKTGRKILFKINSEKYQEMLDNKEIDGI